MVEIYHVIYHLMQGGLLLEFQDSITESDALNVMYQHESDIAYPSTAWSF